MQFSLSISVIILSVGMAAASSAIAAPAVLESSVTGTGWHSTFGDVFESLPQGIDYTLSTRFEYDTDDIGFDSGVIRIPGTVGFTVVAGGQSLSFTSGAFDSYTYLRNQRVERADGYNNSLLLNHVFYTPGGYGYDVWQTISWRDGTAAPQNLLSTPWNLVAGDDYHLTTDVVASWYEEQAGNLSVTTREGNLSVSVVPEPSAAAMLLGGLAAGFLVVSRRRNATGQVGRAA